MSSDTYTSNISADSPVVATSTTLPLRSIAVLGLIADACLCGSLIFLASFVPWWHRSSKPCPLHTMLAISLAMGLSLSALLHHDRAHARIASPQPIHETANLVRMVFLGAFLFSGCLLLLFPSFPLLPALCALILIPVVLTWQRRTMTLTGKGMGDVQRVFRASETHREPNPLHISAETAWPLPWHYRLCKRMLDLIASSALLVLLSPVLASIALLIRISSGGPAFFIQERIGKHGVPFRMYKFRSMSNSAERYELSPTTSDDPRITRLGRFLRRTSLDELPQLLNVFRGDMSLVGPRPEMPFIVRGYSPVQRLRLQVLPGITGLWQLSRDRAYPIHENLHHDLAYIRQHSLSFDVAILIHTLLFAMQGGI